MLCVDEKSQIQATGSDRADPADTPGHGASAPPTTTSVAGTSSLNAAQELSSGKVIGKLDSRHRAIKFKQFVPTIDRDVPAELAVHIVLDTSSTHKTPAMQKWLLAQPSFDAALQARPSSSSLSLVER